MDDDYDLQTPANLPTSITFLPYNKMQGGNLRKNDNNDDDFDDDDSVISTSALNRQLRSLFNNSKQLGGARKRKSRKSKSKKVNVVRKSRKSRKSRASRGVRGVRKVASRISRQKRRSAKKSTKKRSTKKRSTKRQSRRSNKRSKGAKRSKQSRTRRRRRATSMGRDATSDAPAGTASKPKRKEPAGLRAHRELVERIATKFKSLGRKNAISLGSFFKERAKEKFPGESDSIKLAKLAEDIFNSTSESEIKRIAEKLEKERPPRKKKSKAAPESNSDM